MMPLPINKTIAIVHKFHIVFEAIASRESRLAALLSMVRFEVEHVDANTGAHKDRQSGEDSGWQYCPNYHRHLEH
jgi:hypothetical protein